MIKQVKNLQVGDVVKTIYGDFDNWVSGPITEIVNSRTFKIEYGGCEHTLCSLSENDTIEVIA